MDFSFDINKKKANNQVSERAEVSEGARIKR